MTTKLFANIKKKGYEIAVKGWKKHTLEEEERETTDEEYKIFRTGYNCGHKNGRVERHRRENKVLRTAILRVLGLLDNEIIKDEDIKVVEDDV